MDGRGIPTWWRPFWVMVAAATVGLMMIEDDHRNVLPALVGYGVACFGFEYLVRHDR